MKIGILTYHSSHNYGAFLQAYALRAAVENILPGCNVEIINYSMEKSEKVNRQCIKFNMGSASALAFNICRYFMFEKSLYKYQTMSGKRYTTDNLLEFKEWINEQQYDVIIVGSDEVWKLDGYRGFPNPYWLPEVNVKYKLAYGTSSRTAYDFISSEISNELSKLISSFCYIGLRDFVTKKMIDACCPKVETYLNCDPTFVYDFGYSKNQGRKLLREKYGIGAEKKVIGLMVGVPELARLIIDEYSDEFYFVSLYNYYSGTKGFRILNPFEWIQCIAGLDGLITTFYHGMVFSLKYDTPFLAIENREISGMEYSKSYDLLKRNGLDKYFTVLDYVNHTEMKAVSIFLSEVKSESLNSNFMKVCEDEKRMFASFEKKLLDISKLFVEK